MRRVRLLGSGMILRDEGTKQTRASIFRQEVAQSSNAHVRMQPQTNLRRSCPLVIEQLPLHRGTFFLRHLLAQPYGIKLPEETLAV